MSRYTEKLIMQTFNEMLTEMPFDKITVSALTRRSDISHNTFYYHYKDIYHLLAVWIRQEITPYLQVGELYPDREHAICALLHKWQDEERRIYHVFHSLSREQMERYVYEQAEKYFFALRKKDVSWCLLPYCMQFYLLGIEEWLDYPNPANIEIFKSTPKLHWSPKGPIKKFIRPDYFSYLHNFYYQYSQIPEDLQTVSPTMMDSFVSALYDLSSRYGKRKRMG